MTNPPMPAFETLIRMPENCNAVLYFAVVTHEMKVQFMKKQIMTEATETAELYNFLSESKSLFDMIAQEDPAYQHVDMLQNAGLMPLQSQMGRNRPQPVDEGQLLRQ